MRIAVTSLIILLALLLVLAMFNGWGSHPAPPIPAAPTAQSSSPATQPTAVTPETQPAPPTAPVTPITTPPATQPATATLPALSVLDAGPDPDQSVSLLGSDDPTGPYDLKVKFSGWGASISEISLSKFGVKTDPKTDPNSPRYVVQGAIPIPNPNFNSALPKTGANPEFLYHYPFAALAVTVNNQTVSLRAVNWRLLQPGQYEITLGDSAFTPARPVLRIRRTYSLGQGPAGYQLLCRQELENLSATPLTVVWEQALIGDMLPDTGYMGDKRTYITGYYNPAYDPSRTKILIDNSYIPHATVLASTDPARLVWKPRGETNLDLVWLAEVNRYFAAAVYVPADSAVKPGQSTLPQLTSTLDSFGIETIPDTYPIDASPRVPGAEYRALLQIAATKPLFLGPGKIQNLDLALFAGPRDSYLFAQPPFDALALNNLIKYELGCAWCTFQPLAHALLACLRGFHFVVRDWGLSIILLVLVVRLILHPITKKSQINMTKMGKQMSTLQPEIEKLKKKYENDQSKLNAEMMRLYKEKGVNPANMLGCLPMLLQTPIWIALYAMLYYAIELHHQPAFYGVFQAVSAGHWKFLADLSSADNFIHFPHPITIPLIFANPSIEGINVIPILMAVFFYLQQALTMTPAATEQAKQQQKIGKWMTLMVPIFLYAAPCGLTLYMLASSAGGMIDSHFVRKHIKEQEAAGTLFTKSPSKPAKPGGLMDRLQKFAEQMQNRMNQRRGNGKR